MGMENNSLVDVLLYYDYNKAGATDGGIKSITAQHNHTELENTLKNDIPKLLKYFERLIGDFNGKHGHIINNADAIAYYRSEARGDANTPVNGAVLVEVLSGILGKLIKGGLTEGITITATMWDEEVNELIRKYTVIIHQNAGFRFPPTLARETKDIYLFTMKKRDMITKTANWSEAVKQLFGKNNNNNNINKNINKTGTRGNYGGYEYGYGQRGGGYAARGRGRGGRRGHYRGSGRGYGGGNYNRNYDYNINYDRYNRGRGRGNGNYRGNYERGYGGNYGNNGGRYGNYGGTQGRKTFMQWCAETVNGVPRGDRPVPKQPDGKIIPPISGTGVPHEHFCLLRDWAGQSCIDWNVHGSCAKVNCRNQHCCAVCGSFNHPALHCEFSTSEKEFPISIISGLRKHTR